jgi:hypothetical protein
MVTSNTKKHENATETISENRKNWEKSQLFWIFLEGGGCKSTRRIIGNGQNTRFDVLQCKYGLGKYFLKRGCKKGCKSTIKK